MITLSILEKKLRTRCGCRRNRETFSDRPLNFPMIYDRARLQSKNVYVANWADLAQEPLYGMSVICAGEPPKKPESLSCDMIITDVADINLLFNMVQEVFFSILRWESMLDAAVHDQRGVQALLDIGRQELPFSFFHLEKDYRLLASSLQEGDAGMDSTAVPDSLMEDSAVGINVPTETPRYFRDEGLGLHGYVYNFYYDKDYRGKLLAVAPAATALESADLTLLESLCRQIDKIYRFFSVSALGSREYNLLRKVIYALLAPEMGGESTPYEQISSWVAQTQWALGDRYVLCYVPFEGAFSLSSRSEYFITRLENRCRVTFQGSVMPSKGAAIGEGVALVIRLGPSGEDSGVSAVLPELQKVLEPFQAKMCVSSVCSNLLTLPQSLQQAMIAMRIGSERHPERVIYRFSDYALDYIVENCTSAFKWQDVVHPCIRTLTEYDRENGTEMCKTLRVFIKSRYNVLQASNMLYIHRSTFSVRIKRIETLCGIDLEDEPTRLHILISFYILESGGFLKI